MGYQAASGQYLQYQHMRGMSFLICKPDATEALPGLQHNLVAPPSGYSIQPINRNSIQFPYGEPWVEYHVSELFQVRMNGNCLNTKRVLPDGKIVDGESVLRSLADIFYSAMGKYPAEENRVYLRGSESIEGPYYLDEVELRWFNWGFQIESAISQDNNYYKIFPESFNIQWDKRKIIPQYSISFICMKKLAATTEMKDAVMKELTEAKAMLDAWTILQESNWSWVDRMATRFANAMAGVFRTLGDMETSMNRQRTMGGGLPMDYESATSFFSDMNSVVGDIF